MSYTSLKNFLKSKYILSGLAIRLILLPFFAHQFDFDSLVYAARQYFYFGTITYFTAWPWGFLGYLFLLIFYSPARLFPDYIFTFGQSWMLSEKFFLKLPLNVSDLFISYILYCLMVENKKERWAMTFALLYWFNPLSIYVSSIYGTFDAITVLFALLAFYHFIHKKYYLSALELGLGFGIKFQTLILVPVFLILLWIEARQKIPIYLLILAILFTVSFLLPVFVYYVPETHYMTFTFSLSNLINTRALPIGRGLYDPNMSYLNLLNKFNFYWILPSYNDILAWSCFAVSFLIFTFLIFRKSLFEHHQSRVCFVAAYSAGTYMIFYLTYHMIHQHHALWVFPFLMILFAFGNFNRFLFILFNFLPLVQGLHGRDTIFYYINGSYTPYGVNWAANVAVGFLFSLCCLLILQDLFKETLIKKYQKIKKICSFFQQSLGEKIETIFASLLIYTFLIIVKAIYITGPPYWSLYPISQFAPLQWSILPVPLQVALSYILIFGVIPAALVLGLSLNTKTVKITINMERWEYLLLFLSITIVITLTALIVQTTLPYIDYGLLYELAGWPKLFHGWVPVFGTFRILCEHGAFIITVFLLLACLLAIDILLPKIPKNHMNYKIIKH